MPPRCLQGGESCAFCGPVVCVFGHVGDEYGILLPFIPYVLAYEGISTADGAREGVKCPCVGQSRGRRSFGSLGARVKILMAPERASTAYIEMISVRRTGQTGSRGGETVRNGAGEWVGGRLGWRAGVVRGWGVGRLWRACCAGPRCGVRAARGDGPRVGGGRPPVRRVG